MPGVLLGFVLLSRVCSSLCPRSGGVVHTGIWHAVFSGVLNAGVCTFNERVLQFSDVVLFQQCIQNYQQDITLRQILIASMMLMLEHLVPSDVDVELLVDETNKWELAARPPTPLGRRIFAVARLQVISGHVTETYGRQHGR